MVERPRGRPLIRPRDAASLALVRERGGIREVLVGRRNERHAFLPGLYVLPGGTVDAGDSAVCCGGELLEGVRAALAAHARPARARALAVAAIRETWEEAGIPIGDVRDGRLVPDLGGVLYIARAITPTRFATRFHARFFAAQCDRGVDDTSRVVSGELQDLRWLDTGRPPAELPMLDVTRFVIARVASLALWRQPSRVPLLYFRAGKPVLRDG